MSFEMNFNGVILPIRISKVTGRGPSGQEVTRKTIPGRKGTIKQSKRRPERILGVNFTINAASSLEIREKVDELSELLNTEEEAPITFTDEINKTYFGMLDGKPDWDEFIYQGKGIIDFVCFDPDKIGLEKTYDFVNDTVSPVNNGTALTKPTITATFTATATEFRVTHAESGQYVRIIRNFVVGDVLELDFAKEKVTLNGIVNMTLLDWANSDFFELKPGSNTLNVTPVGVANTEITYQERWV